MSTPFLSIVSPVYRAEGMIEELVRRISTSVSQISPEYEIILVEDGSPDASWGEIVAVCQKYPQVVGVQLSRNFGQHYAITAGLDLAKGEWVVVMDCDLQDQPEEIGKMLAVAQQDGFDIVLASRHNRQDSWIKRFLSRQFHAVLTFLTGRQYDSTVANFGVYHQRVIQAVCSMREHIRSFPTMIKWVGFRYCSVEVEHAARSQGKSSYTLSKLFSLAIDIMLAYSDKPLKMMVRMGFFLSVGAFCFTLYTIIRAFIGGFAVLGYASIIASIWLLGGLIIMIVGVVGLYIGKIFEAVKERPIYIIRQKVQLTHPINSLP